MIDSRVQIQPNGIDLTLQRVYDLGGEGAIGFDNSEKAVPQNKEIAFDSSGWVHLAKGCYKIVYNEVVNIPKDIAAIARPRSSLLRSGVSVETAVWDAGYSGRSESLMVVHHTEGFRIKRNARIVQLVFFRLQNTPSSTYNGAYQHENL